MGLEQPVANFGNFGCGSVRGKSGGRRRRWKGGCMRVVRQQLGAQGKRSGAGTRGRRRRERLRSRMVERGKILMPVVGRRRKGRRMWGYRRRERARSPWSRTRPEEKKGPPGEKNRNLGDLVGEITRNRGRRGR